MDLYARVADGTVAELLSCAVNPATLFYPTLQWVDVTSQAGIQVGWIQGATGVFTAPPAPTPVVVQAPTLQQLEAEFASLAAQIAALMPSTSNASTSGATPWQP